jgi:hypothetical protein
MQFDFTIGIGEMITFGAGAIYIGRRVSEFAAIHFRSFMRRSKLEELQYVRANRHNATLINHTSISANIYLALFILACGMYLALILGSPTFQQAVNISMWVAMLLASPVFIFEALWLTRQKKAEALITAHGKLLRYNGFRR